LITRHKNVTDFLQSNQESFSYKNFKNKNEADSFASVFQGECDDFSISISIKGKGLFTSAFITKNEDWHRVILEKI
jgi:hypothetical protein